MSFWLPLINYPLSFVAIDFVNFSSAQSQAQNKMRDPSPDH